MKTESLWHHWQKTTRANPRALALIELETGTRWTRSQLLAAAESFHQHELQGVTNRRILLCTPNSAHWFIAFLASQRGQNACLCLDPQIPVDEQSRIAHALGAAWLIQDPSLAIPLSSNRTAGNTSVVKLTSGSSGVPKQISCRASHLVADGQNIIRGMGLRPEDRNLALLPLGHSYALGNVVLPLLFQGLVALVARGFVPNQIPPWIQQYRATLFPAVPVLYRLLNQLPNSIGNPRLRPLRLCLSAGAVLSPEVARTFTQRFGLKLHNFYGSSETGGICYDRTGRRAASGQGLGTALSGVRITLSSSGRIRVRSSAVASASGSHALPISVDGGVPVSWNCSVAPKPSPTWAEKK